MGHKFRIKNSKGLFIGLDTRGWVSVETLEGLAKSVVPLMGESEHVPCLAALAAVARLPKFTDRLYVGKFDAAFNAGKQADYESMGGQHTEGVDAKLWVLTKGAGWARRPSAELECHGWLAPEAPKGASSGEGSECPGPKEAGWLDVGAAMEGLGWIDKMLERIGMPPVHPRRTRGAKSAKANAKRLVFAPVAEAAELTSALAWAVFIVDTGWLPGQPLPGGFIDDKGAVGPLGRARLFESAAAAASSGPARGYGGKWKVARCSVEMLGLEDFKGDAMGGKLVHALALQEKAALSKALETSSVEDLRGRTQEIDAAGSGERPERGHCAQPKPARRRL